MNSSSSLSPSPSPNNLSLREIPGTYGLPFLGAFKDRWDYFYLQGQDEFFKSRAAKYNSTVFRANMPPGPFISSDPRVVVLLDSNSFPILFDTSKVEKRNVLDGTYMPSTSFTGDLRMCAFLDPSEPKHGAVKALVMSFLATKHDEFIPLFRVSLQAMFLKLEDRLSDTGSAKFGPLNDALSFEFAFRLFCDGKSPSDTKVESNGASMFTKWLGLQLAPLATLGLPKLLNPIEDMILHTIKLPFFLVKHDYKKLYNAFYSSATSFLDEAEKFGVNKEEACHNLVFLAGFNAFGGMQRLFPSLIKWVAFAGESLHRQLADEIRTIVKAEGGVSLSSINKMELTKSVAYEVLRIEPPVPFQYGKAKEDLVIQSHDAAFMIKKGEMIFGYQPFATKDPKIFDNPDEFVGHRFVGEEGKKLLKYVFWSNGRETDEPRVDNKQCPAKDLVVLLSRLFVVELFLRYDTFSVESSSMNVTFLSITKATT